jgi:hypothetical protein
MEGEREGGMSMYSEYFARDDIIWRPQVHQDMAVR